MRNTILLTLALVAGCGRPSSIAEYPIYRDTWEPIRAEYSSPPARYLWRALAVTDKHDVDRIGQVGELIGWHRRAGGFAERAASTGGTHFVPMAIPGPVGAWLRIAVFRVPPEHWKELPAHLIPSVHTVLTAPSDTTLRDGCKVRADGTTRCYKDWTLTKRELVSLLD